MAPEVREGDPATTRSDVWSLGVVLHEIFFGKRPERRTSRSVTGVSKPTTTSSTLERAMRALCEKCLADDPADRPENATAVGRLFEALADRRARFSGRARAVDSRIGRSQRSRPRRLVAVGIKARWGSPTPDATLPLPVPRLVNEGKPADWTKLAKVLASVPGRVHCFSLVDANTVRLIWGGPRQAEDVDLSSGVRRTTSLVPEAYATGCPDLSPNGTRTIVHRQYGTWRGGDQQQPNPDGRDAKPVTPGSDPVWMMNGEEFAYSIDGAHAAVFSLPTMKFRLLGDRGLGSDQSILGKTASSREPGGGCDALTSTIANRCCGVRRRRPHPTNDVCNSRGDQFSLRSFRPQRTHFAHGTECTLGRARLAQGQLPQHRPLWRAWR